MQWSDRVELAGLLADVLSVLVAITGAWIAYRVATRPPQLRLSYGVPSVVSLLPHKVADIEVRHGGTVLATPHVMTVKVACTGRHAITTAHFDSAKPVRIVLSAKPIVVLDTRNSRTEFADMGAALDGDTLTFGPGLIQPGQAFEWDVLVDGIPNVAVKSSLANVRLRRDYDAPTPNTRELLTKKNLGWITLFFLIFYIGTNPGPAADGIASIADYIARLFS